MCLTFCFVLLLDCDAYYVVMTWSAASFLGHLHATKYCLPKALEMAFSSVTAVINKTAASKEHPRAELLIVESVDEIRAPTILHESIAVPIGGKEGVYGVSESSTTEDKQATTSSLSIFISFLFGSFSFLHKSNIRLYLMWMER